MQRLITNKIRPIVTDAEMSGSISELGLRIMLGVISFTESGRAVDIQISWIPQPRSPTTFPRSTRCNPPQ